MWLERPFEELEVYDVVRKMEKDSIRIRWFFVEFFQTCWNVIKEDLMQVFHELFFFEKFDKSINSTFLALIPKKNEVLEVKDFWPISLANGVYKIISMHLFGVDKFCMMSSLLMNV